MSLTFFFHYLEPISYTQQHCKLQKMKVIDVEFSYSFTITKLVVVLVEALGVICTTLKVALTLVISNYKTTRSAKLQHFSSAQSSLVSKLSKHCLGKKGFF